MAASSPKKKILALAAALIIGAGIAAWLATSGGEPSPAAPTLPEQARGPAGEIPRLVGSWFVRYLSDPQAYLDVATDPPAGGGLARVTAHLTGPTKTYPDIELRDSPRDREWQMTRDPLPTPLAGGTWWVSQVKLLLKDGRWIRYHAADPFGTYRVERGGGPGPTSQGEESRVWIGSFYATEADPARPRYTVHTFPAPGGKKSNPTLQVYRPADPVQFIAVNDDPDVDQDYARLSLPLTPGETYLIRVDDRYHELGDYCLQINRSAAPSGQGRAAPAGTHPGEPDDEHTQARPIQEGAVRCLTFKPADGLWGDRDWLRFTP